MVKSIETAGMGLDAEELKTAKYAQVSNVINLYERI